MSITSYSLPVAPGAVAEPTTGGADGTLALIEDHCADAVARLLAQYADATKLQAVLCSYLDRIQELEQATLDVYNDVLSLETAAGSQLDLLGELIGESRDGRTDDAYRLALRVRVLINISNGRTEELIAIARLFEDMDSDPTAYVRVQDMDYADMEIRLLNELVNSAREVDKRLRQAKAAGVGMAGIYTYADVANTFTFIRAADYAEKNTTQGFSLADDSVQGGRLSQVIGYEGDTYDPSVTWTPAYLLPEGWWDASALVLSDTDPVATWSNLGTAGSAADLTQGTGAAQPLYVQSDSEFNGLPVVDFDGTDDVLTANGTWWHIGASDSFTVAAVVSQDATGFDSVVDAGGLISSRIQLQAGTVNTFAEATGTTFFSATVNGDPTNASYSSVLIARFDRNAGAGTIYLRTDGGPDGSSVAGSDIGAINAANEFYVGRLISGAFHGDLRIAEIVFIRRFLDGSELALLEDYFNTKYGI